MEKYIRQEQIKALWMLFTFQMKKGVDCQFESSGLSLGSGVCQMGLPNQPTPGLSMPVNINTPIISNKDSVYCLTDMPVEVLSDIGDFWYSDQNLQYEVGQGQSFSRHKFHV